MALSALSMSFQYVLLLIVRNKFHGKWKVFVIRMWKVESYHVPREISQSSHVGSLTRVECSWKTSMNFQFKQIFHFNERLFFHFSDEF
jgi:hypothetical protein